MGSQGLVACSLSQALHIWLPTSAACSSSYPSNSSCNCQDGQALGHLQLPSRARFANVRWLCACKNKQLKLPALLLPLLRLLSLSLCLSLALALVYCGQHNGGAEIPKQDRASSAAGPTRMLLRFRFEHCLGQYWCRFPQGPC